MPTTLDEATLTVALIGNPNTGKSTLFGAVVGIHQHVGNYPGVTVEKKTGRMEHEGRRFQLVDLPGLYSLAARSRDEMVAVEVLLQRQSDIGVVDVVLCIVDGSNLERHLYLVSQVMELGLPTVVAVNMLDVAASRGIKLELRLCKTGWALPWCPSRPIAGTAGELKTALMRPSVAGHGPTPRYFPRCSKRKSTSCKFTGLPRLLCGVLYCGRTGIEMPGAMMTDGQLRFPKSHATVLPPRWCGACFWMPADTSRIRFCQTPMSNSSPRSGRPASGSRPAAARFLPWKRRYATLGPTRCSRAW